MAPARKGKNELFFTIRDKPLPTATKAVKKATLVSLNSRYRPTDQTTLFFAAARKHGQDNEALALCKMLLAAGVPLDFVDENVQTALFYAAREGHCRTCTYLVQQGVDVNHVDKNQESAIFYAANRAHWETVRTLLQCGARLDVINQWGCNIVQVAAKSIAPKVQEEINARKRKTSEEVEVEILPEKRRRVATPLEALRDWANEWPSTEAVQGQHIEAKVEDLVKQGEGYAVVRAPVVSAARLRISEKNFVVDHAELMAKHAWFANIPPDSWCRSCGVIEDGFQPPDGPISAIKGVLSNANPNHFTLALIETESKEIAGYVHCQRQKEQNNLLISHVKVDELHKGKGLGGLLIKAAEEHSHNLSWNCDSVGLSVLEANTRATRCYEKNGFKCEGPGSTARWGPEKNEASMWQRWTKSHQFAKKKTP